MNGGEVKQLFIDGVEESPPAEPVHPEPKAKRTARRLRERPLRQTELATTGLDVRVRLPGGGVDRVRLPEMPSTIADCRQTPTFDEVSGEWQGGICPVLRCKWNLLTFITREGDSESINIGGRGGKGKGITITASQNKSRTIKGVMTPAQLERETERAASMIEDICDVLPSTCPWDYIENPDLIPGRAEIDTDEDGRTSTDVAAHMTLDQVGTILQVTREAIRIIELRALAKMRACESSEELQPGFVPVERLTSREWQRRKLEEFMASPIDGYVPIPSDAGNRRT